MRSSRSLDTNAAFGMHLAVAFNLTCPTIMSTSQNSQLIRFFHRGEVVEAQSALLTRPCSKWLCEDAHCTGNSLAATKATAASAQ